MDGFDAIAAAFARMGRVERPLNPDAAPVTVPWRWASHTQVRQFFDAHKFALTWEQVDELVAAFDELKRNPPPEPEKAPDNRLAERLEAGWRQCKAATVNQDERLRRMAKVAATELGEAGTPQIKRVYEMYTRFGMEHTNAAVVQLCGEALDVASRFKYLAHRTKTIAEFEI